MRMYLTKRVLMGNGFLILSLILLLHLLLSFSFGSVKPNGVCISKRGRFKPYESEGTPPKAVGLTDLNLCGMYHRRTCCSAAQTHPSLLAIRNLSSHGEADQDCLNLYGILECSICDPDVGSRRGPPRICVSFCDRVFQACSEAYFGGNTLQWVISPCGVNNDIICGKASDWESDGVAFCKATGFAVQTVDDTEEESCFGSKASLDSLVESYTKGPHMESPLETEGVLSPFRHLLQWLEFTTVVGEIVCVLVGRFLVLHQ